jgi:hypothetical protein
MIRNSRSLRNACSLLCIVLVVLFLLFRGPQGRQRLSLAADSDSAGGRGRCAGGRLGAESAGAAGTRAARASAASTRANVARLPPAGRRRPFAA